MTRVLVTILGDYLGKIVNMERMDNERFRVTVNKLVIYEAEPVTRLNFRQLHRIWREMLRKADEYGARLFLVIADTRYDQYTLNNDDVLPVLKPDATALIVLRDRKWEKVPYEVLGLQSPVEAELVSSWYTRYNAMLGAYKYMLYEVDRYRNMLIRYAEYSKRLHERLVESEKLITELMKKSVDFQTELQSMYSTIRSLENYIGVKNKESKIFKDAYEELLKRVKNLLNIAPRVVELTNKLATFELSKEVEESMLTTEISKLEKETMKTITEVDRLKEEINRLKESKVETVKETAPPKEEEVTEETGEEEGGGEEVFLE